MLNLAENGIEILLMAVLLASNELLVIDEIDKPATHALAEKRTRNLGSMFDTSVSGNLPTVSVIEVVDRVEKVGEIPVDSELKLELILIARPPFPRFLFVVSDDAIQRIIILIETGHIPDFDQDVDDWFRFQLRDACTANMTAANIEAIKRRFNGRRFSQACVF